MYIKKMYTHVMELIEKNDISISDIDDMLESFGELQLDYRNYFKDGMPLRERLTEASLSRVIRGNHMKAYKTCNVLFTMVLQEEHFHPGSFDELKADGSIDRLLIARRELLRSMLYLERRNNMKYRDKIDINEDHVYGRIIFYSPKLGYGFIYTEDNKEVFLSSIEVHSSKRETCLRTGGIVTFVPAFYKDRVCATNVRIVDAHPVDSLTLPNGLIIDPWDIEKLGKFREDRDEIAETDGISANKDNDTPHGVYINLRKKQRYEFHDHSSTKEGDGKIDTKEFYDYIRRTLFYL